MSGRRVRVIEAGRIPYHQALAWQRGLAQARIDGRLEEDLLLLLEHPPVVTLGRTAQGAHVLRPEGVDVVEVERGGDVTFHGPGQLVGYPILDLRGPPYRQDLHWYLRTLEEALITALAEVGIPAERRAGYTGVWTGGGGGGGGGRKIASIGVHVKQWVTWHGFALNVTTDLSHFDRIVPCGIEGVEMTSVERETKAPGAEDVWAHALDAVVRGFEDAFGVKATASREDVTEMRRAGQWPISATFFRDAFP